jgi:hypothetical protein
LALMTEPDSAEWVACWQLTIIGGDGEMWLDRSVGMADPTAPPPTGLILPGCGWRLTGGAGWQEDMNGAWAAPVCPVSAEAEAQMRRELGLL